MFGRKLESRQDYGHVLTDWEPCSLQEAREMVRCARSIHEENRLRLMRVLAGEPRNANEWKTLIRALNQVAKAEGELTRYRSVEEGEDS